VRVKHLASNLSRLRSAVTSSAVGFQLGCISWDADPHKLAMVQYHCGHDPGNVALRPGDIPMSADLARDVGVG
jgi:hypothetical protein